MSDEMVDIVDERGRVLRQVLKTDAHVHGWLHKTVIGCLRKDDQWHLVRQAADRQDAGQLVNPVGGHVRAGEADVDALLRESEEEIGTRNIVFKEVGRARFHRQVIGRDENHLFIVYEITTDDSIMLNHESESIHDFTENDLQTLIVQEPHRFGAAYYFVLENFIRIFYPLPGSPGLIVNKTLSIALKQGLRLPERPNRCIMDISLSRRVVSVKSW